MTTEHEKDTHCIWHDVDDYQQEHINIVVKDKFGKEYDNHQWVGHAYYEFVGDDENGYDGWRTDVETVGWRYQDEQGNH